MVFGICIRGADVKFFEKINFATLKTRDSD